MYKDEDLEFHTWPPSRGGQHVGVSSGVLVIHKPTGVAIVRKNQRSMLQNKDAALQALYDVLDGRPDRIEVDA